MDAINERYLKALLAWEGLEPREGDLERFGPLIEHYVASLKELHSVDLGEEEIAPVFHLDEPSK